MRIYLKLGGQNKLLPFNYQEILTGAIHRWIGTDNAIHGKPAGFSFSWIQNTRKRKGGLEIQNNSYFFISAHNPDIIKAIMRGILKNPKIEPGFSVLDIQIASSPDFSEKNKFIMGSPVLLKIKDSNNKVRHVTFRDPDFERLLTENVITKLEKQGLSSVGVRVLIDPDSTYRSTKLVSYKGIKNKTSYIPLILEGNKEQLSFVWNVGLGHSTGIGFGSLK